MKRLVAWVEETGSQIRWTVEIADASGWSRTTDVSGSRLEAMASAEKIARARGFGVNWQGLVAHGIELEELGVEGGTSGG